MTSAFMRPVYQSGSDGAPACFRRGSVLINHGGHKGLRGNPSRDSHLRATSCPLWLMNLGHYPPAKIRFAKFGFGIYNDERVSDPRGLRDSLAAGARVAPV